MSILKKLLAHKATKLGIGTAFVFQIVFFTVWLTAYDGVEDRVDQFTIAVINDNESIDQSFMTHLQKEVPFTLEVETNLEDVKKDLNQRKLQMVMHIPESFLEDIQEGSEDKLVYYINQSTPSLEKQMMETAASTVTKAINQEVYSLVEDQMKENIPLAVSEQLPDQEQATIVASFVLEQMESMVHAEMVEQVIYKEHDVEGFTATMIPLMVVLASFIGAIIMSQQLQIASSETLLDENLFSVFVNKQMINVSVSFILSVVTLSIMLVFGVELTSSLFQVWLFQSVLFLSFLSISQLFVILFGNPGMIFNVILTATQLVSSGAIVPRNLLPEFYKMLGKFLPATHGVNGYFSIIYGGGHLLKDLIYLLLMTLLLWALALFIVWIYQMKNKQNVKDV